MLTFITTRYRAVTVLRGCENGWQRFSPMWRLGDGTTRQSGRIRSRCISLLSRHHCWLHFCRGWCSIVTVWASCSTQAPATPTPIISITPSGWAACCRCGWTFCESRARRRHSPERFALSYEMKGAARARRRVIEERRLRSTFGLPSEASGTMEGATLARSRCNSHSRVSWRRFSASRCAVYSGSQGRTSWDFWRIDPSLCHTTTTCRRSHLGMDGDAPSVMGSPELEDHDTFVIENAPARPASDLEMSIVDRAPRRAT